MIRCAPASAKKGRLGPSFFLCLWAAGTALAQQPVYRCGQEYTNAPREASRCEPLLAPAITVIPGTRVQTPTVPAQSQSLAAQAPAVSAQAPSGVASAGQGQREDMARSILSAELEQARLRHVRLLEEFRQGEPERLSDDNRNPQHHRERMDRLKAALERSQRDIDSLQRELARRPLSSAAR